MKSPNAECRNPKEARMTKSEERSRFSLARSVFGFRHSFVIRLPCRSLSAKAGHSPALPKLLREGRSIGIFV